MNNSANEYRTATENGTALRGLPAVHQVLAELVDVEMPRPLILSVVRSRLDQLRAKSSDRAEPVPDLDAIARDCRGELKAVGRSRLGSVINATGIIIHTNLGRAPLSESAARAVANAARDYVNLEYDVVAGDRGGRGAYLERTLALLCEAGAATVVNNCAGALVLLLRHFASRPPRNHVIISRGELIQIGGGFRVPEILEASGATLCEVGTTNKTTLDDYARAIDDRTAMILRVHRSNFFMGGFVESPSSEQLAKLARGAAIPLVEDLGSGATFDTVELGGNEREPTPRQTLAAGVDLVTFSGDKLLGGPQAGIIAGSVRYVADLKQDPFFRALRCDKLVMAALEATVDALLTGQAQDLPIRQMMQLSVDSLRERAGHILQSLGSTSKASIGSGAAQVGGGSLPQTVLPSVTIDLSGVDPLRLADRLRAACPPVVGYIGDGVVKLDLRTVFPRQDAQFTDAIRMALEL